ncbi:MAG: LysR family transcriptional regulator [Kangiellaceae bacterium]
MRLRHIEVFHAVYTTGSVTNAAKKLYVSQPSVSKVLGHAEQQLGFPLFDRIKGRLAPTKEADLLFKEVDKVYRQLVNINDAADNIKNNEVGNLTLAVTPALGFNIIPSAVMAFSEQHENVSFNIQTIHNDRLLDHLRRYQSEIAVLLAPDKFAGVSSETLGQGKLVAVYSKKQLPHQPQSISLNELVTYPLISIWDSGPLAEMVWQATIKQNIKLDSRIKVRTYFIAVNLVKYGAGICIVDEFTAKGQLSEDIGIAELEGSFSFPVKALYLENKPLSKVSQRFISFLSKEFN